MMPAAPCGNKQKDAGACLGSSLLSYRHCFLWSWNTTGPDRDEPWTHAKGRIHGHTTGWDVLVSFTSSGLQIAKFDSRRKTTSNVLSILLCKNIKKGKTKKAPAEICKCLWRVMENNCLNRQCGKQPSGPFTASPDTLIHSAAVSLIEKQSGLLVE